MIAVFALAAAVCIGCFSLSKSISTENYHKDNAVILAQNTAEMLKHTRPSDIENSVYKYSKTLNLTEEDAEYIVTLEHKDSKSPLMKSIMIYVFHNEKQLFELNVCYQDGAY